ncbi:TniQ family protein [Acidisphaera sp. L21]|uniref:TniQ family protein n=1 Tax=Acidisphaera sp. L21 TaxID=1641851 RepID=UPI002110B774|nr:TniQ family protein [Acidisphaera sp. L21]
MSPSKGDPGRHLSVGATPRADESLPGFIMRLADRTRFASADKLAILAGLRQPGSAATNADLSSLALLARADEAQLVAMSYRRAGRSAHQHFLGGEISREFIRLDCRRFCPQCLSLSLYHRARWDLALATACGEHGVRLIERCPGCHKRFGWREPGMERCACGAYALKEFQSVSGREAVVAGKLLDLLEPHEAAWLAAPLACCSSGDLLRLLMSLGMFLTAWPRQRRIEALVAAGPDTVAGVVGAGMQALEDWPASIHGFLARQEAMSADRRGRYGARKSLGAFYNWLTEMAAGPVKDALAQAAAGFVARDPELARRTHRSRLLVCEQAVPALGLLEAAKQLKTRGTRVKRIMAAGLVPPVASEGRGIPMLISRSAVEHLATAVSDSMTLAQAAAALGICVPRMRSLVQNGLVQPVHRGLADGRGPWAFARQTVLGLPDELAAEASEEWSGRTMDFDAAAEALRRRGIGLAAMLAKVSEGNLQVRLRDRSAVGLKQLRFSSAEVRCLCRALEDPESMTLQAAAERMGLKWQVVANLVDRGLLPSWNGRISAADTSWFLDAHVSGGQLAREWRTSPRALAARLEREGVLPVAGPGVDGSRQNFFARSNLGGLG